ncbi:MAG: hypothetical protein OXF97_09730 [Nitrospira sp.]|nr:hypothetical protein [Nitrospira sp.]
MRIKEEIKSSGYFWLPSSSEKKLPGTLTISDGGKIELEVVGLFDKTVQRLNSAIEEKDELEKTFGQGIFERIVGQIEKHGLVTLDGCFYKHWHPFSSGISKSLLHVSKALLDIAYVDREPLVFNALQFSVEGIDEWVGISGINVDRQIEEQTAIITYSPLDEISLNLNNDMKLLIIFSWTLPGFPIITEAKITQKACFKLVSQQERPLDDFISIAQKLTTFLCFAVDKTVCINQVTATLNTGGSESSAPIPLYYESLPYTKEVPKIDRYHMLFRYPTIKAKAEQILNNWLKAYDKIEPALNLYFGVTTGGLRYLDAKVLALAQGLETYHRRTSDETRIDNSDFEKLRETLITQCPEEHKDWLSERLNYGNELSLRQRIKRIIEPFNEFIGDENQRDKLTGSIVDTRNYLTHYDESSKSRAASGDKLIHLYLKMEAIFQLCILQELGFTRTEIKSVLDKSYRLRKKLEKG